MMCISLNSCVCEAMTVYLFLSSIYKISSLKYHIQKPRIPV